MGQLALLVPVLGRPHRVQPLLDSVERSTPDALVVFLADPLDYEELRAIRVARSSVSVLTMSLGGNYARKINDGIRGTTEYHLFFGADDLDFQPGWYEEASRLLDKGAQVVGVNDMLRRRRDHATHFLVTRDYCDRGQIDGAEGALHEGYRHNFCDDEFVAVAKKRGVYRYTPRAKVAHQHWINRKAEKDETYKKGLSSFQQDRKRFKGREALWM